MEQEKEEFLNRMNEIISKPGGKQAARFALNSLGSLPLIGGVFAATGNLWGEKEQREFNVELANWAFETNTDLSIIINHLASELRTPSKVNLALLIGEIAGVELPESYPSDGVLQIGVILHGESINQFQPYIQKEWIKLTSNGNMVDMNGRNQFSGCIVDKKRPWGIGNGFILSIEQQYYECKD